MYRLQHLLHPSTTVLQLIHLIYNRPQYFISTSRKISFRVYKYERRFFINYIERLLWEIERESDSFSCSWGGKHDAPWILCQCWRSGTANNPMNPNQRGYLFNLSQQKFSVWAFHSQIYIELVNVEDLCQSPSLIYFIYSLFIGCI